MRADKVHVANQYFRDSQFLSEPVSSIRGIVPGARGEDKGLVVRQCSLPREAIGYDVSSVLSQTSSTYSILNGLPEGDPSSMNAGKYVVFSQLVPDGDFMYVRGVFLSKEQQQPNTG